MGIVGPGMSRGMSSHEALSRMCASEVGGAIKGEAGMVARLWCCHAVINEAARRKMNALKLLCPDGKPGSQLGKYASTRHPATDLDRRIAWRAMQRHWDPTGGATNFDAPRAQDQLVKQGEPGYKDSADKVAANRTKDGLVVVKVPGVPLTTLRLWRRVGFDHKPAPADFPTTTKCPCCDFVGIDCESVILHTMTGHTGVKWTW
jgi:hypothetical protein